METQPHDSQTGSFESAQRLQQLNSPEQPTAPERQTTQPSLVIEQWQDGETAMKAVLCEHTTANAPAIAAALQDCDILALEEVGLANLEERRLYEKLYTDMISRQADPSATAEAFSKIKELDSRFGNTDVLYHLQQSDKKIVLLDTNRTDPNYPLIVQSVTSLARYSQAMAELKPQGEIRAALLHSAIATAASDSARDQRIADQLQALRERLRKQDQPVTVGIMLGATHYGSIETLRQQTQPDTAGQTREHVYPTLKPFQRLVEDVKAGDTAASFDLAQRALLHSYLQLWAPADSPVSKLGPEDFVAKLSTAEAAHLLAVIDRATADETADTGTKAARLKADLAAALV